MLKMVLSLLNIFTGINSFRQSNEITVHIHRRTDQESRSKKAFQESFSITKYEQHVCRALIPTMRSSTNVSVWLVCENNSSWFNSIY